MRRSDRPRAQNNLVRLDGEPLAAALDFHACCASAIGRENDALHGAVRANCQVEAMPHRIDVAERSTPAYAVGIVESVRSDACCVWVVMVRIGGKPRIETGVVKCNLVSQQVFKPMPLRDDRAIAAVKVVLVVHVGFELAKVGQHILVVPLVIAHRHPVVEVVRDGAQEDLPIYRAGATHYLAARHIHRWGSVCCLPAEEPVVAVFNVEKIRAGAQT